MSPLDFPSEIISDETKWKFMKGHHNGQFIMQCRFDAVPLQTSECQSSAKENFVKTGLTAPLNWLDYKKLSAIALIYPEFPVR